MKAFIIGETGLLGYNAALELLKDGHEVSGIGITPPPKGDIFKKLVKYEQIDVKQATDKELFTRMEGNDWLLCAFSANQHQVSKRPVSDYYTNFNIYTIERILRIARDAKIKKVVLLSNYLEYFNIEWAYMGLSRNHPYIKSLYEQEMSARGHSLSNFKVVVLQLPMIFGVMPKRTPFDYKRMLDMYKNRDFSYFKGGTAVMTVKQVGQAILGAFKFGQGGRSYALGCDNMTYKEINQIIMQTMGLDADTAKFKPINKFIYKHKQRVKLRKWKKENLEAGINPLKIIPFYEKNAYIKGAKYMKGFEINEDDVREQIKITAKRVIEIAKQNEEI